MFFFYLYCAIWYIYNSHWNRYCGEILLKLWKMKKTHKKMKKKLEKIQIWAKAPPYSSSITTINRNSMKKNLSPNRSNFCKTVGFLAQMWHKNTICSQVQNDIVDKSLHRILVCRLTFLPLFFGHIVNGLNNHVCVRNIRNHNRKNGSWTICWCCDFLVMISAFA